MTQLRLTHTDQYDHTNTNAFAEKKFHKIISLLPSNAIVHLTFTHEKERCRVDANITSPGQQFNAKCVDQSYYGCLKHLAKTVFRLVTKKKVASG